LIFMLLLINDKKIMGNYVNSTVMNILSWATVAVLISLSLAVVLAAVIG
jgi:Mn2+/Fe2+ NRAMP family transporter